MSTQTSPNRDRARLPGSSLTIELWNGSKLPLHQRWRPNLQCAIAGRTGICHRRSGPARRGRAYVSGEIEIDDIDKVIDVLNEWKPPAVGAATKARLITAALRAAGVRRPPRRQGRAPSARPQAHHRARSRGRPPPLRRRQRVLLALPRRIDDLLMRVLLPRPTAQGIPPRAADARGGTGGEARARLHQARARAGQRVLDVGCGWGSFVIHAASRHGVEAVGITLSENQAELARKRVDEAGVDGQGGDPRPGLPRAGR